MPDIHPVILNGSWQCMQEDAGVEPLDVAALDVEPSLLAARPARARAAVKKTYVAISDSDKSESEEEDSEFEVSE